MERRQYKQKTQISNLSFNVDMKNITWIYKHIIYKTSLNKKEQSQKGSMAWKFVAWLQQLKN